MILEQLESALRKAGRGENSEGDSNYVTGDVVEFGCYRGDTSLLIEKMLEEEGAKMNLWIYDSFEGLPARTREDASAAGDGFSEGELFVSKREVVERFKKAGLRVPKIRKGFFGDLDPGEVKLGGSKLDGVELNNGNQIGGEIVRSSNDLPDKIIFAFLDGDLYQSIKTSLNLVTPRLVCGTDGKCCSVIIIHDYNNPKLPGVAKAVDEWMTKHQKTAPRLQRRESLAIISW